MAFMFDYPNKNNMIKTTVNGVNAKGTLLEGDKYKICMSDSYNYIFNKSNGYFQRWGGRKEDDPEWSPFGAEIADIEISEICHEGCKFCYKSNTTKGRNMDLETFIKIFDKFPKTLTQIAFGIGSIDTNPDMWKMFEYCRLNAVAPNLTINGSRMTPEYYDRLASLCGAVTVSLYDYDRCYDAVENLGKRGMKQVNIHAMLSEETYDRCMQVMKDYKTDPRLSKYLNAIVFLWLKPKGRGEQMHKVSKERYEALVDYAITNNIPIGFDSCSASNFLKCKNTEQFKTYAEPCESTLFSIYINVVGEATPCSFAEDVHNPVDVLKCNDFINDVWMSDTFTNFRKAVIANLDENGCRMCPIYNLAM